MKNRLLRLTITTILLSASTSYGIFIGQVDDFQDNTTMGWQEGGASPNAPINVADAGPLGIGDNALFDLSSGTQGPGGRAIMFNRAQWTGDYLAAGVDTINGYLRVAPSSSPVMIRIAVEGGSTSRYASSVGISIPNDDQWYPVSFNLDAADMTSVGGADSLSTVLSNVNEFRILSSNSPNWRGDAIFSEIYVDNLTAVPEPAGLALLALGGLLLLTARTPAAQRQ